ncbi:hypothetical protein QR680_004741 [Steinernema hermaphroditum]|uniref:Chondroitin proteoglycan 4 domain-containing protein n=1 Tax=Steinernema hermaphroditum TaxID=289476 RepID=A0AA39HRZ0_9BILA|nr:hypothetical protein QR680_004741 [Steinernema hermaphroditum]
MFHRLLLVVLLCPALLDAYSIRLPAAYADHHPCVSRCVANFSFYGYPTNILESDDYAAYLVNLTSICPVLLNAHDCVDQCNDRTFNPFSKRLYETMCKPDRIAALQPHLDCLKEQSDTIKEECVEVCGSMEEIVTSISNLTYQNEMKHDAHLEQKITLFEKYQCGRVKCYVQCSRSFFSKLCPRVHGVSGGTMLQTFILDTLRANLDDMQALHTKDSGPLLPNCTFLRSKALL